jgi:hypothetical protein
LEILLVRCGSWVVSYVVQLNEWTWPVAIFTMDQRKEQQVWIKFSTNLGKSAMETLTVIQQAFMDQILSHTQVFQWHVQDRSQISWHWWIHRETHKLHNFWNCCMNSRARLSGLTFDHSRHCWGGGNWLWDMPTGSDERNGHAPCCSQICAQDPDSWPEAPSSFWQNTEWLSSPTHRTPLVWHPVISSKNEIEAQRTPVCYHWGDPGRITGWNIKPRTKRGKRYVILQIIIHISCVSITKKTF